MTRPVVLRTPMTRLSHATYVRQRGCKTGYRRFRPREPWSPPKRDGITRVSGWPRHPRPLPAYPDTYCTRAGSPCPRDNRRIRPVDGRDVRQGALTALAALLRQDRLALWNKPGAGSLFSPTRSVPQGTPAESG